MLTGMNGLSKPRSCRTAPLAALATALLIGLAAGQAHAVVDTVPQPCGANVCLWDKPRIDPPKGWTLDEALSRSTRVSVFTPADRGLSGAPAVFYARAAKREENTKSRDVAAFAAADLDRMLSSQLTLSATSLGDLKVDNARFLRRRVATSTAEGTHETLAYVEDGEYFVTFVLSARSAVEHDRLRPVFERWLRSYKVGAAP
ncbi:hypothetical protein BH10PSE17_BH10PSE17_04280 [soil metagenome]